MIESHLVAELHFFTGTMDSGKSTLALQTNHNHAARGRVGRIFTTHDRAGEAMLSSRLGLEQAALEVSEDFNFWRYVVDSLTHGARIDYLICDEAQFYSRDQVDLPKSSTTFRSMSSPLAYSPTSAPNSSPGLNAWWSWPIG